MSSFTHLFDKEMFVILNLQTKWDRISNYVATTPHQTEMEVFIEVYRNRQDDGINKKRTPFFGSQYKERL